jgi:hypothetical protein
MFTNGSPSRVYVRGKADKKKLEVGKLYEVPYTVSEWLVQ